MKALDEIREELKKKGANSGQLSSKLLPMIMDVVSGAGDKYSAMYKLENDIMSLRVSFDVINKAKKNLEADVNWLKDERQTIIDEINEEIGGYCEKFIKALNECETPEARDRLRIAQMFVNSVHVEGVNDNAMYIAGLASILSNGEVAALDELQKMKPNKPKLIYVGGNDFVKRYEADLGDGRVLKSDKYKNNGYSRTTYTK